jgi:uncharacterized coiled-coil protein SlyX
VQANAMSDEWLTYEEAAVRLGVTPRAARMRAFRGRWAKTKGNDGRALVRFPDERPARPQGTRATTLHAHDSGLVSALRAANTALEAHVATLKADIERLEAQLRIEADRLTAAEAQAEKRASELSSDLAAERAKTEKAIEAFSALADRLDAFAAANQRQSLLKRLRQRLVG